MEKPLWSQMRKLIVTFIRSIKVQSKGNQMSRESVETQTGEQQEIQFKKERIWMSVVWRFLDVGMAWRNMPST